MHNLLTCHSYGASISRKRKLSITENTFFPGEYSCWLVTQPSTLLNVQYVPAGDAKYTMKAALLDMLGCVKCAGTFDELEKAGGQGEKDRVLAKTLDIS